MKRHIKVFVKEMFGNENLLKSINRKFYPSNYLIIFTLFIFKCKDYLTLVG